MVLQAQGVSDSFARDACARVPSCKTNPWMWFSCPSFMFSCFILWTLSLKLVVIATAYRGEFHRVSRSWIRSRFCDQKPLKFWVEKVEKRTAMSGQSQAGNVKYFVKPCKASSKNIHLTLICEQIHFIWFSYFTSEDLCFVYEEFYLVHVHVVFSCGLTVQVSMAAMTEPGGHFSLAACWIIEMFL